MSLHGKIVSWFAFFAALTVLLFGLGDYIQSTRSLRFALDGRVSTLALQAAAEAERRYDAHRTDLVAVASAASVETLDTLTFPGISRFSTVQVTAGRRRIIDLKGTREALPPSECAAPDIRFDFEFPGSTGDRVHVTATMPTSEFFSQVASATRRMGTQGITAVVRTEDGTVLQDFACGLRSAEPAVAGALVREATALAGPEPPAIHLVELQGPKGQPLIAGIASAPRPGWAVVVLRGIRSDLRRLTSISQAAEAIGHGRFDVWLPPPTNDEIGRLTLALGRMMDRLASSLRQIEVTRSMAAVGELSTYLSHEIRNPLSSIRLNLQMLRRDLATGSVPEDGQQLVDLCLTELRRLDDVVKTVLEVGRNAGVRAAGTCDAHAIIEETVRVMQRKLDTKGVTARVNLAAPDAHVAMDGAALRGLLMNLMLNSMDAMNGQASGRISIATSRAAAMAPTATWHCPFSTTGPACRHTCGSGSSTRSSRRSPPATGSAWPPRCGPHRSAVGRSATFRPRNGAAPSSCWNCPWRRPARWPSRTTSPPGHGYRRAGGGGVMIPAIEEIRVATKHRIMVVEDDAAHRSALERHLARSGFDVLACESAEEALGRFSGFTPDLVISDIRMGGMSGMDLLGTLMERAPGTRIILTTAYDDMQVAVDAMRYGAVDFLMKPLDLDEFDEVLEQVLPDRNGWREPPAAEMDAEVGDGRIVGRDPQMVSIYKMIGKVAATDTPILIRGETGTGKELVARTIHDNSLRKDAPFICVNCAALPETAARVGAVRSPQGLLHRRHGRPARPLRAGQQRHHPPGRDRGHGTRPSRPSCSGCSRRRSSTRWAARLAAAHQCPGHRRDAQEHRGADTDRRLPAGPVLPAARRRAARAAPPPERAATSRASPGTSP
jgi:ActR/RegA family two-component response regulator/signal transduction histidine kinase